jgi:hypothetical protein
MAVAEGAATLIAFFNPSPNRAYAPFTIGSPIWVIVSGGICGQRSCAKERSRKFKKIRIVFGYIVKCGVGLISVNKLLTDH